jgi:hypothetical protein
MAQAGNLLASGPLDIGRLDLPPATAERYRSGAALIALGQGAELD